MPPTDTGTPDPTLRDLAAQAVKTWALSYPIPAWNLAEGEAAERLAAAWGRTAADAVLAAVAPVIRAQAQALTEAADALDKRASHCATYPDCYGHINDADATAPHLTAGDLLRRLAANPSTEYGEQKGETR